MLSSTLSHRGHRASSGGPVIRDLWFQGLAVPPPGEGAGCCLPSWVQRPQAPVRLVPAPSPWPPPGVGQEGLGQAADPCHGVPAMGTGWDSPMAMCWLDTAHFPLGSLLGTLVPPNWGGASHGGFPGVRVLFCTFPWPRRRGGARGQWVLSGTPQSRESETSQLGGHCHAGYFWYCCHRDGEGWRGWDRQMVGGTDTEPWHCGPPSPAAGSTGVTLEEVPIPTQPVPGWVRILVPSWDTSWGHIIAVCREDVGGSGSCLGLMVGIPTASTGGWQAWHCLLAVPLFSSVWRCLPPSSSCSSCSSSRHPAQQLALGPAGCSWLPGALHGGPVQPGRGAQPRAGGSWLPSPGTHPPPSEVTQVALVPRTLWGDSGAAVCPTGLMGGGTPGMGGGAVGSAWV